MGKRKWKLSLWILAGLFILLSAGNIVFAYGGGGGEGGGEGVGVTSGGTSSGGFTHSSDWEEEYLPPDVAGGTIILEGDPPPRDPFGDGIKKPGHWTQQQWKNYVNKRQTEYRRRLEKADAEKRSAERNTKIAEGTGIVVTGAGAVVTVVAAPAIAPTVIAIAVVGDGLAATAGSLAEGKSVKESAKDGVKKSVASAVLSKVSTGKKGADIAIGFVGSLGYDNVDTSKNPPKSLPPQMPPPDFTTSGGHGIYK